MSVALGIQHAKRMSDIILSSGECPTLQQFSTLSEKQQDLKKKTKNAFFYFLYNFSPKHFSF